MSDRDPARCGCGRPATHQAVYEHADGTHLLSRPACDEHALPVGPAPNAIGWEVIDRMEINR